MSSEKFNLKWNDFQNNVNESFRELRDDLDFCDITLVSEGNQQTKAHKVILAASSTFFMEILRNNKHNHPIIYMRGIKTKDLASILDYIYHGETNVCQGDLNTFLALAEDLELKGLEKNKEFEEKSFHEANQENITGNMNHFLFKEETSHIQTDTFNDHNDKNGLETVLEESITDLNVLVSAESPKSIVMNNESDVSNSSDVWDTMIQKINGKWTCSTCGKINKQKYDAKKHAETHIDGDFHHCNSCGIIFRSDNAHDSAHARKIAMYGSK